MSSFSNPGIVNGAYIEFFTGQTTDVNGKVVLTLAHTPTASNVFVVTDKDERSAKVFSISTNQLTVIVRKTPYDKTDTPVSTPSNLPASTSVSTTVGGPSFTSGSASASAVAPTAGVGAAVTPAHTHAVVTDKLIDHKHTLTYTATSQAVAASEGSLNFVVIYR